MRMRLRVKLWTVRGLRVSEPPVRESWAMPVWVIWPETAALLRTLGIERLAPTLMVKLEGE